MHGTGGRANTRVRKHFSRQDSTHVSPRVFSLSTASSIVGGGLTSFLAPKMRFMAPDAWYTSCKFFALQGRRQRQQRRWRRGWRGAAVESEVAPRYASVTVQQVSGASVSATRKGRAKVAHLWTIGGACGNARRNHSLVIAGREKGRTCLPPCPGLPAAFVLEGSW